MKLPLARYRYTCRMTEPLRLPHYAGSVLRGQFGASLRRISCMTQADTCQGCPLRASCPYSTVFAAPAPEHHHMQRFSHIPNPYVLEPPPIGTTRIDEGQALNFNLVLFGHALNHLPLISGALQHAIEQGVGPTRARGILERIDAQDPNDVSGTRWNTIWQRGDTAFLPHETSVDISNPPPASATIPITQAHLLFETPLRLQHQGTPLQPHALSPRKLIADLLRRITLLAELHAARPNVVPDAPALVQHATTLSEQRDLRWHDWRRYSSRQRQEMTLGGVLGSWTLTGNLDPLAPWLRLGQWLHIGKNAVLGLGSYRLHLNPFTTAAGPCPAHATMLPPRPSSDPS